MNVHLKKKKRKSKIPDPLLWESCLSWSSFQAEVMVCIIYFIIYLLFFTEDLRGKLGPVLYSTNFSVKKRDEHLQSTVFTWLSYFEKLAPVNSTDEGIDGLYFASERLTWVDYVLFDLLDTYVEFGKLAFDGQVEVIDVLANFPRLKAFYENFASRPRIAKYLRAERRVPFRL